MISKAVLDHELGQLVMRNPNRPAPIQLGTLVTTDDVALAVRSVVDEQVNRARRPRRLRRVHEPRRRGQGVPDDGGGCHGCSMSRMTMLEGVQTMIMEAVPTITKVVDATDHSTGENPYYT